MHLDMRDMHRRARVCVHLCLRVCDLYTRAHSCTYPCSWEANEDGWTQGPRRDLRGGRRLSPHNYREVLIFPAHLRLGQCPNSQGKEAAEDTGGKQSNAGERFPLGGAHTTPSFTGMRSWAGSGSPKWPPAHKVAWGRAELQTVTSCSWADL